MTGYIRHASVGLAMMFLLSSSAVAQIRWGRGPVPRAGACFYEHADFEGRYFCVGRGEDVGVLPPGMNDSISSIRIFGEADVIVFRDGRFRGESARFSRDVRNLQREGWNDTISSLRVEGFRGERGDREERGERDRRPPMMGRSEIPEQGACFYKDADFRGEFFCVPRGTTYAQLPPGFNDQISSIRVLGGARVTIFEDDNFSGRSDRVDGDVRDLGRRWNDTISSFRVF